MARSAALVVSSESFRGRQIQSGASRAVVALGLLARRMFTWPFLFGMTVYALDGVVLILFEDSLSAAFHGYVPLPRDRARARSPQIQPSPRSQLDSMQSTGRSLVVATYFRLIGAPAIIHFAANSTSLTGRFVALLARSHSAIIDSMYLGSAEAGS